MSDSSQTNRRGFLAVASLGGVALAADPKAEPEIETLKKKLADAKFSHLPAMVAYLKRLESRFGPGVV